MINWINSWKIGNKKNKIDICLRIGVFTLFELYVCLDKTCKSKKKCDKYTSFRFMILNLGVEI